MLIARTSWCFLVPGGMDGLTKVLSQRAKNVAHWSLANYSTLFRGDPASMPGLNMFARKVFCIGVKLLKDCLTYPAHKFHIAPQSSPAPLCCATKMKISKLPAEPLPFSLCPASKNKSPKTAYFTLFISTN